MTASSLAISLSDGRSAQVLPISTQVSVLNGWLHNTGLLRS